MYVLRAAPFRNKIYSTLLAKRNHASRKHSIGAATAAKYSVFTAGHCHLVNTATTKKHNTHAPSRNTRAGAAADGQTDGRWCAPLACAQHHQREIPNRMRMLIWERYARTERSELLRRTVCMCLCVYVCSIGFCLMAGQVETYRTLIPVHVYTTNAHHTTHLTCFITGQTRAINFIDKRKSNHNEICATHNKILIHTGWHRHTHAHTLSHMLIHHSHTDGLYTHSIKNEYEQRHV